MALTVHPFDQAAARRKRIFITARVPNLSELSEARVTVLRPLQVDNYGIIVTPAGVMVGRGKFLVSSEPVNAEHNSNVLTVIGLYSKTGGKNGKHSSVGESSNISAISYLAVQVLEHMYARQFRSVPAATAIFQTRQYMLLLSINFLTLLDYKESSQQQGSILELSHDDLNRFRTLQKADKQLQAALKLSRKRGKNSDDED